MPKSSRRDAAREPKTGTGTTNAAAGGTTADAIEQQVVAFAEQLGRVVGTVQAKAEGWLDREALQRQMATVRDGAAALMHQLGGGAAERSAPKLVAPRKESKGRSGGVVDAPGKKHRKPAPPDPAARNAASQAAKMRTAKSMAKTNRRRGRG